MPNNEHMTGSITVYNALVSSWTKASGQLTVHKPFNNVSVICRAEGMKLTTINVPSDANYHINAESLAQDMYVGEEVTIKLTTEHTYTFTSDNVSIAGGTLISASRGIGDFYMTVTFIPTAVVPVITCDTQQTKYDITIMYTNMSEVYDDTGCTDIQSGTVFKVVADAASSKFNFVPATGYYITSDMISVPPEAPISYEGGGWDANGNPLPIKFWVTSVIENMTITATPQPVYATIKFNANGGTGTLAEKTVTYQNSTTLYSASSVTPPDESGKYKLVGWHTTKLTPGTSDDTTPDYLPGATYTHTENKVTTIFLYALYKTNEFTVTINANASNCYLLEGDGGPFYQKTYTVKFGQSTTPIRFGVEAFGYSLNTTPGNGIHLSDASKASYLVDAEEYYPYADMNYWNSCAGSCGTDCDDLPYLIIQHVKANQTVTFTTTPIVFRVTFLANKPSGEDVIITVPNEVTATYNNALDLSEDALCAPSYYVFKGWRPSGMTEGYLPESLVPTISTFPNEAHINVHAAWDASDYTFAFDGGTTSTATNVPSTISRTGSVTITITPISGYTLENITPTADEC